MILLGISKYPMQSAKEMASRMMEMSRLPDYIKGKGNYLYDAENGSRGLVIYEFESAKADEAIHEIANAYWNFYDVPGFSYQLIPLTKAVLSIILCEIYLCQFFHKWQIGGDFPYGFRPPVEFHL
jgi:hypothetical protein